MSCRRVPARRNEAPASPCPTSIKPMDGKSFGTRNGSRSERAGMAARPRREKPIIVKLTLSRRHQLGPKGSSGRHSASPDFDPQIVLRIAASERLCGVGRAHARPGKPNSSRVTIGCVHKSRRLPDLEDGLHPKRGQARGGMAPRCQRGDSPLNGAAGQDPCAWRDPTAPPHNWGRPSDSHAAGPISPDTLPGTSRNGCAGAA